MAKEYLDATKTNDREKLRTFINLKLGKSFEEDYVEGVDYSIIESHLEDYGADLSEDVLFIIWLQFVH